MNRFALLPLALLLVACGGAPFSPLDSTETPVPLGDAGPEADPPAPEASPGTPDAGPQPGQEASLPPDGGVGEGSAPDAPGEAATDPDGSDSGCPTHCTAKTCTELGATCGTQPDGCGGTLECGTCNTNPGSLAPNCGGGVANVCGPDTCSPGTCEGKCGTVSDGCGGILNCAACTGCGV